MMTILLAILIENINREKDKRMYIILQLKFLILIWATSVYNLL